MAQALLIFKPDASYRLTPRAETWRWLRGRQDIQVDALKWFHPPSELIETHYDFLRGRSFFPWLVEFMSAFPLLVGRLSAEPADLERLRHDLGETRIQESRPGSLRERFGIFGGINCLHLSDSPDNGAKEIELWSAQVRFDGIEADPAEGASGPDHTYHLRSLAGQVAAGRHVELATESIRRLLVEETGLEGERMQAYQRIIQGALA